MGNGVVVVGIGMDVVGPDADVVGTFVGIVVGLTDELVGTSVGAATGRSGEVVGIRVVGTAVVGVAATGDAPPKAALMAADVLEQTVSKWACCSDVVLTPGFDPMTSIPAPTVYKVK